MQNFELRLEIVILKLVTWMNSGWISTSENWIIIKTKFFLWGSFRLECQKSLCVWFIRAGEPWIWTIFFKLKSSAIAFKFCLIFSFFNDHFLLFILASVAANHKTATESDLLNHIAGVSKYAHDKIDPGAVERWQWMRLNIWILANMDHTIWQWFTLWHHDPILL